MSIVSLNPATGETLRRFEPISDEVLERVLARAATASRAWRRTALEERVRVVARAGEILDAEKEAFGRLMTLEMGKPIQAAIDEAAKCASACRWYAEHAARILAPDVREENKDHRDMILHEPLGVVLAIMPWNFPFWQVLRFAAPALCAGNVALLKHASNVPQCALAIEDLFKRAGAPKGVFTTLLLESRRVTRVLADPRVAAATITGSEAAGSEVAATAGKHLKKTVLELGGSDPFVVMPSANIAKAAATAVTARTINNGQSCIAAKRFIVHQAVYSDFLDRFVNGMKALKVGDPMDRATQVGPLATAQIAEDLETQVARSVAMGARIVCGGKRRREPGNYYEPTVLVDVPVDSPAACEELFGPVAPVFKVANLDEAIARANDTPYGLGAAAWTSDAQEIQRFSAELEAGSVFINGMVASDPRYPFGGIKRSGYGRELSEIGMLEFCNVKTVRIGSSQQGLSE